MKKIILLVTFVFVVFLISGDVSMATYTYKPLETIPGTSESSQYTFPGYVQAIYKFAIWTVGIAALLMISIGGFIYFTAAGNTSRVETAKKVIGDALFGLAAVMVAWIIFNKINPDLVKIDLSSVEKLNTSSK